MDKNKIVDQIYDGWSKGDSRRLDETVFNMAVEQVGANQITDEVLNIVKMCAFEIQYKSFVEGLKIGFRLCEELKESVSSIR